MIRMRRALPGLAASKGVAFARLRGVAVRVRFCRFRAPAFAPWQPAFGQAQTRLEQIIQPPKIDSSEPMLLQADEMVYDNDNYQDHRQG